MYITKKLQQTSNQAAKKLGRKGGRKRKITDNKLSATKKLLESDILPKDVAKKLGRKGGRKRKITDNKLSATKKLLESDILPKDVAKKLGVSLATLYRWIPTGEK
jgi:hypothetical protein